MSKEKIDLIRYFKPDLFPILALIFTASFIYIALPISNEFRSKNKCIQIATKQLKAKLPESYIEKSGLRVNELSRMLAYQLCTHRNDN